MGTGVPERIPQDIMDAYGLEQRIDMDYRNRKIAIPKEGGEAVQDIHITEYLLDANHHVNNGKYVELAAGIIPEQHEVKKVRVEYRKQAFLGEVIKPRIYRMEDRIVVDLSDTEGNPYSVVEFQPGIQI